MGGDGGERERRVIHPLYSFSSSELTVRIASKNLEFELLNIFTVFMSSKLDIEILISS